MLNLAHFFRPLHRPITFTILAGVTVSGISFTLWGQPAKTAEQTPEVPKEKEWRDYAGSPEGTRFMPLSQIDKSNVSQLAVAWIYPYAETGFNPIVAHGIIYTKARNKSIVALDAATGKEIWIHDGLTGMTERGMNYWENADGSDRRLIFCLADYLQEIDAKTGKLIRNFGHNGAVDIRDELGRDPNRIRVQSNSPGKVFENLILIGSAVGEGFFSAPGDLRAYNILTGKLAWQFHTVPHPGESGYETWPKDAWRYIGGVNTWGEISVDSARGIAYFPTGSATTDYFGADRVGNDLYANCLLAIDARTGKLLWHFQNVHHDLWDFDDVTAPLLTTITQNGRRIDVVAMAGKTGYLYVFNRVTGEPIWPIEEKKVPTKTDVPGEVLSATQPIPTAPPPFTRQTFTVKDINPYMLTDQKRAEYVERVTKARYDGQFTPIGFDEVIHMPGNHGGANWGATSANPNNGTAYVIGLNGPALMRLKRPEEQQPATTAGGRGAAQGAGAALYAKNCAACHGPDRMGGGPAPSLINISARLAGSEVRKTILEGKGQMPGFHEISGDDVDQLIAFLIPPAAPARGGRGGRGGPATVFSPGPIVESGPAAERVPNGGGRAGVEDYPAGVDHPAYIYQTDGYGLDPIMISPPYTTLTSYDLNKGVIKWQIGLGDDYRVLQAGGPKGTGAAEFLKSSVIPTSSGLLFVNAADRKVHIYDSETGKQVWELAVGATTSGSPSMFELSGRQFLLVTASPVGTRIGGGSGPADPNQKGPVGLVAYALKN